MTLPEETTEPVETLEDITSLLAETETEVLNAHRRHDIAETKLKEFLGDHPDEILALRGIATFLGIYHEGAGWAYDPYGVSGAQLPPNLYVVGPLYKDGYDVVDLSNVGMEDSVRFRAPISSLRAATDSEVQHTAFLERAAREK